MYKDLKNLFNRINLIPVEVAMRIMNIVQINKTDLRKYPWKGKWFYNYTSIKNWSLHHKIGRIIQRYITILYICLVTSVQRERYCKVVVCLVTSLFIKHTGKGSKLATKG